LKKALVAYGCNMVTEDNPYQLMSEDQAARYVRTRGQIKMCDPYLNTRVIQVRTTPLTAKELKAEAKENKKEDKKNNKNNSNGPKVEAPKTATTTEVEKTSVGAKIINAVTGNK
jgi:hypothetical protein